MLKPEDLGVMGWAMEAARKFFRRRRRHHRRRHPTPNLKISKIVKFTAK